MDKRLYNNIIRGIQKGIRQSMLNEDSIYNSIKDNSIKETIDEIVELCYEADKNNIHSNQGLTDKYWDIAEIVIGDSDYGEVWSVCWNSNMNGHYKSRVNCKDISEYELYSISITYREDSDHTFTIYFGDDYVKPDYMQMYKTRKMTNQEINLFYEYIEKLVWESTHPEEADEWRKQEREQEREQNERQEEIKRQAEWKNKLTDLIYEYAVNKLKRRKNIFVEKSVGTTQAEGNEPYTAIAFYKNKKGPYGYIGRIKVNYEELDLAVPLCGHSYMKLSEENYKEKVDYCIDFMLN